MYSLFETVYSKNVGLINVCHIMSDDVIQTASQISKNLFDSDESQRELKKLNENYQNILSVATGRRDNLIESKSQIQQYKDQINELKKTLSSTKATPESNKKLIKNLNSEIKILKIERDRTQNEWNELTKKIKENSENLVNLKNITQSYIAETKSSAILIEDLDKEKAEIHQMNEETQKEINEVESENTIIEEKQLEEKEKLDLQRDKVNTDEFSKLFSEFHKQILILQEEKDYKLQSISKMSKQLKKIKTENSNKLKNRAKILDEIDSRNEQLDLVQQSMKSLNNEHQECFPQYVDVVKKFKTLQKNKLEMREKYKKLQEERFLLNIEFSKNENDRQLKLRKVQQETNDNRMQVKYVQRETFKTEEISRQALDVNNDMTNIKRGIFEDGRYAKTIQAEIEDKLVQRKFYISNYLVEKNILDNNLQKIEYLHEQINEKRKKGEEHFQQMKQAKEEKETFAKKMESVQKEYDQLSIQYTSISNEVENLTARVDTLLNDTIHDHILTTEYKTAISYLTKMKKRSEKGIKITKKVIFGLISEQKTLKKIIDQTALDQLSQKKQLQNLKISQDRIVCQISEKVKELDEKTGEFLSLDQQLKKSYNDYNNIMEKINQLNNEFDHYMDRYNFLQELQIKMKELLENKKNIENNLMIAKCKTTALLQESRIKMHVHRWNNLMAVDPDFLFQLKFHQRLKAKLIQKDEELKKLIDQKNQLACDVENRKKYVDRFFQKKWPVFNQFEDFSDQDDEFHITEEENDDTDFFITSSKQAKCDFLLDQIELTKRELKEKTKQISEMKKKIEIQSHLIVENRESVKDMRQLVNDRKSIVFQLKSDLNEMKSKIRFSAIDQITSENNNDEIKLKSNITVLGGGFRPNPPKNKLNQAPIKSARKFRRQESPQDDIANDGNLSARRHSKNSDNRRFHRKINRNIVDVNLDRNDDDDDNYVVKKRNGRVIKMKKKNDHEDNYNYDATNEKTKMKNNDNEINFLPRPPPNAQEWMRPNINEIRKKLTRNVSIPDLPSSKNQEKKKKKSFKKKNRNII